MIKTKSFAGTSLSVIHETWIEAFSDYQVKIDMPIQKLEKMFKRRGVNLEISCGAYSEGKLVGFMINGKRMWHGVPTAYDSGTAVVPGFRKQGVSKLMFDLSLDLLRKQGCKRYLLEVISENQPAIELYKKSGFSITRSFICVQGAPEPTLSGSNEYSVIEESVIPFLDDNKMLQDLLNDFTPSWQNSPESIYSSAENLICFAVKVSNETIGLAVLEPVSGDVPFFGVSKTHRGKKLGCLLLRTISERCEAERLSFLNIDGSNKRLIDFLIKKGLSETVGQYEMMLDL